MQTQNIMQEHLVLNKLHAEQANHNRPTTKEVQGGITLHWDTALDTWIFPQEDSAAPIVAYNDTENRFFVISVAQLPSNARELPAAEFPESKPVQDLRPQKEAIAKHKLDIEQRFLEMLSGSMHVVYIGMLLTVVVFFWGIISQIGLIASAFAAGSAAAITEIGYLIGWGVGLLAFFFLLKYALPLLFARKESAIEEESAPARAEQGPATISVNINQNSPGGAQDFINNR